MIAYFDTSALVPLLVEEPSSTSASELWLAAERVTSSRIVYPEARSALARAQRNGRLTHRQLRSARRGLGQILDQVDSIELTASVAKAAGALAEGLALRAYDAVHLASASILDGPDFVFVSGDRRLVGAAMAQNLNVASLARGN